MVHAGLVEPRPVTPGPGQESVWDYPRPPRVEPVTARLVVVLGGRTIADTTAACRVLETSHPPVYYLPMADFTDGALSPGAGQSYCEFKGPAAYLDVTGGDRVERAAAWHYPSPAPGYEALVGGVAVYPARMDACLVDGEIAQPQPGGFYGGWITAAVVGPFKGDPGTRGW
ncbi:MAG: DUF427 domain-containing protein [Acidimicrobiales bacterium]